MANINDYLLRLQELQLRAFENGINCEIGTRDTDGKSPWIDFRFYEEGTKFTTEKDRHIFEHIALYDFQSDSENEERVAPIIAKAEKFIEEHKIDTSYLGIERCDDPKKFLICLHSKEYFGDDEEHDFEVTCFDGCAQGDGITLKYPKLAELSARQLKEIDEYTGMRVTDSGCVTTDDVCLKYGEIVSFGIMDTTNSHDADLVRKINLKWAENKEKFRPILVALYERDLYEIMYSEHFSFPEAADSDYVYSDVQTKWDFYARDYLMYIADDRDLESILNFVR